MGEFVESIGKRSVEPAQRHFDTIQLGLIAAPGEHQSQSVPCRSVTGVNGDGIAIGVER